MNSVFYNIMAVKEDSDDSFTIFFIAISSTFWILQFCKI